MNSTQPGCRNVCSARLDHSLLLELSRFVEYNLGLHFAEERLRDLERGICSAAAEFGYRDSESFIHRLFSAPLSHTEVEMLAGHLTVGETYFFRDKAAFSAIAENILPELIKARNNGERRIRIWSAGCSSGEEAYSLAILLNQLIHNLDEWGITILATDVNPNALKKASKGIYTEWSFRDTPEPIKNKYFKKRADGYEIRSHIKKMVTFSYHNLAADAYPALSNNTTAMDIIFCRNVLMYFSRERGLEVVRNLRRCLVDGGWLLISPVETTHMISSEFSAVKFTGATLYRKSDHAVEHDYDKKTDNPIESLEAFREQLRRSIAPAVQTPAPVIRIPQPEQLVSQDNETRKAAAAQLHFEEAVILASIARESANEGRLSDALDSCEKALALDKFNASLYYLQATILQEMQKVGESAASLKKALYMDQNFVIAHFALGCLMRRAGRNKEAEKHLANARSLAAKYGTEDILPDSEGISAGRLIEIIDGIGKF